MKNTRTLILVFLHIVVTNFINLLCAQLRGSGFVNIHSEMQQPVVIFISSKTNCQIAIGLCSLLGHSAFDDSFSAVNDWGVFSMLLFASCSSFFPASTSAACQFRCLETMNSIWWMSHSIPNDMLRSFVHFISLSYIHITHKLWSLFDEGESERCRRKCVNFVTSVNINSKNEKVTNKKKVHSLQSALNSFGSTNPHQTSERAFEQQQLPVCVCVINRCFHSVSFSLLKFTFTAILQYNFNFCDRNWFLFVFCQRRAFPVTATWMKGWCRKMTFVRTKWIVSTFFPFALLLHLYDIVTHALKHGKLARNRDSDKFPTL